jgi:hypothetical protein
MLPVFVVDKETRRNNSLSGRHGDKPDIYVKVKVRRKWRIINIEVKVRRNWRISYSG